jgi:hypothetical protein
MSTLIGAGCRDCHVSAFFLLQIINEKEEADLDAVEMSVEELQKWTNDDLNGTLQVRRKGLQLLIFALP